MMVAPKLRPAEEIAREMVGHDAWMVADGLRVCLAGLNCVSDARAIIASVLTRAREEGAAAERAAQNDQVDVQIRDDWKTTAIDHYREGLHRILNGEPNPQAMAACYLGEDAPSRPRDLAGCIRALVQEYAGRWADAIGQTESAAIDDAMTHLREALRDAKCEANVWPRIAKIRIGQDRWSAYGRIMSQAADELEAIVRECAKDQQ